MDMRLSIACPRIQSETLGECSRMMDPRWMTSWPRGDGSGSAKSRFRRFRLPPTVETPRGASPKRGGRSALYEVPAARLGIAGDFAASETPHGASLHWGRTIFLAAILILFFLLGIVVPAPEQAAEEAPDGVRLRRALLGP